MVIDPVVDLNYFRRRTAPQWGLLEPLLPPDSAKGHPRAPDLGEVVNGILYVLRGGIPWRMMPHDLPPWGTVWWYFRKWRADGTWEGWRRRCAPWSGRAKDGMPPHLTGPERTLEKVVAVPKNLPREGIAPSWR